MNLEAIALRRAQEQDAAQSWKREDPRPRVRLVKPYTPGKGGTKPTCECGTCRKCRNREAMRAWRRAIRAGKPLPEPRKRGPKTDPHRRCSVCSGPISRVNVRGVCKRCAAAGKGRLRANPVAFRRPYFSHGGGI